MFESRQLKLFLLLFMISNNRSMEIDANSLMADMVLSENEVY